MKMPVLDMNGKQVQEIDLPANIFEADINVGLMHQALVRQLANARLGTHMAKTRAEVNISKAKIYRQKGTGRARHGAKSAPVFVGGGRAHPPRPRKYTKDMPKKMRRQAIRSALSALVRDEQLVLVDELSIDAPKTKQIAEVLQRVAGSTNVLVVLPAEDKGSAVYVSARNLPKATVLNVNYLNIRDLLNHEKVVVPLSALDVITGIWG